MEEITFNRQQLHELVWSESLRGLSKKYCISDNGLRKMCKTMNIPLPPNGYWSKIQYGKDVIVERLPEEFTGKSEIKLKLRADNCNESSSIMSALKALELSITSNSELPLCVPDTLTKPDILVKSTINYYDAIKRYRKSRNGEYPNRIDVLSIDVSDTNIQRALLIMDSVIKLLRARNHDVIIKNFQTFAIIEGEEVKFRLRERKKKSEIKDKWGYSSKEFTGELVFVIDIGSYSHKEVKEGKGLLETKLVKILAELELEGERKKELRIRIEKRRIEQKEEDRIERKIQKRTDKEARKFKKLFKKATRLHQANILRIYIQTIEDNARQTGVLTDELKKWIKWAQDKVEWYDPLINKKDKLLNEKYKTNFFKDFISEWQ